MRNLIVSIVLASIPLTAVADTTPTAPTAGDRLVNDDCAKARKQNKTCVITIEDETIEGGRPSHDGNPITTIDWGKAGSLISLRRDFIAEIIKSAADL